MNTFAVKSLTQLISKNWILCVLIMTLPFLIYFQAIDDDYILDDKIVLSKNSFVEKGVSGIPDILTHDSFYGYFKENVNVLEGGRYRPLSLITFAIEYEFWGNKPEISHIINLLIYGATGILIFILIQWLQTRFGYKDNHWFTLASVAALLYILHPIHSEAVVNIKGRDELLSLFFSLFSLISFISAYKKRKLTFWVYSGVGAFFMFLALLSKENAITFVAVIPITIYYLFDKIKSRGFLLPTISIIAISGIYLLLRFQILGETVDAALINNPLNNPFYGLNTEQSWGTVFYTLSRYVELLIFPHPLSHDYYPYAIPTADFTYFRVWIAILIYSSIVIYAIYGLIRKSIPAWSAIFFLCTFSIVSNVFFTVGTTMNERFIYMPSVAFSLVSAYFIYRLRKWLPWLGISVLVLVLGLYGYKTIDRVQDWQSHLALNKSAVENAPNSARSQLFYGTALFKKAQATSSNEEKIKILRESLYHLEKAQSIFNEKGTEITKHFIYSDAVKMKAGASSELYKLGAMDITTLLSKFKEVLRKKPSNTYTKQFLQYLNRKNQHTQELVMFYREIGGKIMPWYGQNVNQNYYNYALDYLKMGLDIAPNDQQLLDSVIEIYRKLGRKDMVRKYQEQL